MHSREWLSSTIKNSLLCVCISFFYFILIYKKGEILWKKFGKILNGYEGFYQVSNLGKIKSLRKDIIMKQYLDGNNYYFVPLYKDKKTKSKKVHRLVAETFIKNPNNYPCINHKDENSLNNNLDNLEWCTYSYNVNYDNRIKKYCLKRYKKIEQYDFENNLIKKWDSIKQASNSLNISKSGIIYCAQGKFKQFKGYIWKYIQESEDK